ncbi:MAG: S8 family serine peptidase [Actinomyces sp.]|uniref:S8 family serine peptidase n=1 Tax=Actinomyces sp. TaxID=29317 RepID=UPI0026DBA459|nr:S8 family serine peptidase [Actinomyces sp.]MDO4242852.1 S8 family serine peptidase [Actinomyces sp.]
MPTIPARRRLLAAAVTALTACVLVVPAASAAPDDPSTGSSADPSSKIARTVTLADGSQAENIPGRWFIELTEPAQSAGGSASAIGQEQDALVEAIDDAGIEAEVTAEYGQLWNGVTLAVDEAELDSLAALDEVVSIQPVVVVPRPESQAQAQEMTLSQAEAAEGVSTPQMTHALGMTGADVAQSQLGYTGEGVSIGIIDSGVDYDLPEFGGTGVPGPEPADGDGSTAFPTGKVTAGYDFVGNAYGDPAAPIATRYAASPDSYPDDCDGHGTHVAGIAAADGQPGTEEIRGVAPDADLAVYRVLGCQGSTGADVIAAAMERAAADGVDVVNISIGADFVVFTDYPTAVAAENLASQGVIVTASQGNLGEGGRWTMGAPAAAEHVLAVGSVDNTVETNFYLTVSTSPGREILYTEASGSTAAVTRDDDVAIDLVAAGDPAADGGDEPTDASVLCQALPDGSLSGKAVLVRRGACAFRDKVLNAQNAGATAVILDNNVEGGFIADLYGEDNAVISVPVVTISQADGQAIRAGLTADSTFTFSEDYSEFAVPTTGQVSYFSSWGLNEHLSLKPDVVAPGGLIWSTWPLESDGPHRTSSGTSMASPYVAGAAALIVQAHPEIKNAQGFEAFEEVAWRLRSTAAPVTWTQAAGDPALLEPLARQGAGLIAVDRAIQAELETDPSVINLGQSQDYPSGRTQTFTLTNRSAAPVTYALSHVDAVTITGGSWTPVQGTSSPATVSTDGSSVTVPAGGSATLEVTITAPAGIDDGDFYGGWIVLTPASGQAAVRIPFSGVGGNLGQAEVFGPNTAVVDAEGVPVDTATYVFGSSTRTTEGMYEDRPGVLIEPLIPFRGALLEVLGVAADGTVTELGQATIDENWYLRSDAPSLVWDGSYVDESGAVQQAPTGQYQLRVSVLPVGDDGRRPEDWATWTSPTISIDWKTEGYIEQSELSVVSPADAVALVDDNIFTTVEQDTTAPYDSDLGAVYDLTRVHYTPDQELASAHATSWTVSTSLDGVTWTEAASGQIDPARWAPAVLELPAPVSARFLRVELANAQTGQDVSIGAAEIRAAGERSANQPTAQPTDPASGGATSPATAQPTGPAASGGTTGGAAGGTAGASTGALAPGHAGTWLARTGATGGLIVVAIGLLAGGALLMVRRRRA